MVSSYTCAAKVICPDWHSESGKALSSRGVEQHSLFARSAACAEAFDGDLRLAVLAGIMLRVRGSGGGNCESNLQTCNSGVKTCCMYGRDPLASTYCGKFAFTVLLRRSGTPRANPLQYRVPPR